MNPILPLTVGSTGAVAYAFTGSNEALIIAGAFTLALIGFSLTERRNPEQATLTDYEN
mgnify:FL=1